MTRQVYKVPPPPPRYLQLSFRAQIGRHRGRWAVLTVELVALGTHLVINNPAHLGRENAFAGVGQVLQEGIVTLLITGGHKLIELLVHVHCTDASLSASHMSPRVYLW